MTQFRKGDQVYRYYTCEPSVLYGGGKRKEKGVVIGDLVEWEGKTYVPVKWQYNPYYPSLDPVDRVFLTDKEGKGEVGK